MLFGMDPIDSSLCKLFIVHKVIDRIDSTPHRVRPWFGACLSRTLVYWSNECDVTHCRILPQMKCFLGENRCGPMIYERHPESK